ncbi:hypothetical protein C8R26_103175 [Nitrosomonas oligotropha]|uniref:Uncharacterized protein n=1 Tax=Nitrosomonas oligotropha TaxID=42354 RepID=A0A2T5I3L3_9PROT|nr:hypothetical protein C8R26_103175 [Nitrosomonas oligotropha]
MTNLCSIKTRTPSPRLSPVCSAIVNLAATNRLLVCSTALTWLEFNDLEQGESQSGSCDRAE